MKVAVVGATGMVGQTMIKVLEERNFPVTELIPAASEKSVGKEIIFRGKVPWGLLAGGCPALFVIPFVMTFD